jgi:hypothetical protein
MLASQGVLQGDEARAVKEGVTAGRPVLLAAYQARSRPCDGLRVRNGDRWRVVEFDTGACLSEPRETTDAVGGRTTWMGTGRGESSLWFVCPAWQVAQQHKSAELLAALWKGISANLLDPQGVKLVIFAQVGVGPRTHTQFSWS